MRFIAICLLFSGVYGYSQTGSWMLNHESMFYHLPIVSQDSAQVHTGIRPYRISDMPAADHDDSLAGGIGMFNNHILSLHDNKIYVDPVITSMVYVSNDNSGSENGGDQVGYEGALGLNTHWDISPKLSVHATYFYSRMNFNNFQDTLIRREHTALGFGLAENIGKHDYYSHFLAGKVVFRPDKMFEFELGQDKHFFGNGYRSLILSDHSDPFPYLKITTAFWKVKYVNLFAVQRAEQVPTIWSVDADPLPVDFHLKYTSLHYLSMNFGRRFNLALFESVVWDGANNEFDRGFEPRYLNPVIFYRPVEFAIGSPDNVQLGMEASYLLGKHNRVYGQLMLDEFLLSELRAGNGWWGNKYGLQLGILSDDVAGIKGLRIRAEGNVVRPYTYTHGSSIQNYGHFNRALAHPLGANFKEAVLQVYFKKKRMIYSAQFIIAEKGYDGLVEGVTNFSNYGGDIFLSNKGVPKNREYGNFIGQGVNAQNSFAEFKAAYILNPAMNLAFELGGRNIVFGPDKAINEFQLFVGLKTRLYNRYLDYL